MGKPTEGANIRSPGRILDPKQVPSQRFCAMLLADPATVTGVEDCLVEHAPDEDCAFPPVPGGCEVFVLRDGLDLTDEQIAGQVSAAHCGSAEDAP